MNHLGSFLNADSDSVGQKWVLKLSIKPLGYSDDVLSTMTLEASIEVGDKYCPLQPQSWNV